jgi:long-chain fatty acid transport protein
MGLAGRLGGASALALASLLTSASAHAAIDYVTDLEAVAQGQAGAFVAAPYTLSAVWYNPAGLANLHGLELELEAGLINSPLSYTPAADDYADSYPTVTNRRPLLPAGLAGASYDFGLRDLTCAFVAYVPQSNSYHFDPDGPQRFQSVGGSYVLAHFHGAVAYRLADTVALGFAIGPSYFSAKQESTLSAAPFGNPEASGFSIPTTVDVEKAATLTGSWGISVTPNRSLAIGASFMPGFTIVADGHATLSLPPTVAALATVQGDAVTARVPFPTVARLGVRYKPRRDLAVEIAGVYEGWSRTQELLITPDITVNAPLLGYKNQPLSPIHLVKKYRDVGSVRLGAEYQLREALTVRAGVFYETNGLSPGYFDLSAADGDKLGLTGGASLHFWKMSVDLSYGHIFVGDADISDSKLMVNDVVKSPVTRVIGNGTYSLSYDTVHLGVRFHL